MALSCLMIGGGSCRLSRVGLSLEDNRSQQDVSIVYKAINGSDATGPDSM